MHITWPWQQGHAPIQQAILDLDGAKAWVEQKVAEENLVMVTGAVISAVASAALSWQTTDEWPWTANAVTYSALILSLASVYTACQQMNGLLRYCQGEKGAEKIHKFLKGHRWQEWTWSIPLRLLNVSISLLVISIWIVIWDRAARAGVWNNDMKTAFATTLAGIFALVCSLISGFNSVYILPD
ncbi:hypothetical protein DRE_02629 [Drechslerella stenobrocha 248]|uniref:Uncharacterized protein n=1 Tax=Drechslerella stenobrocha 248 TaxID=1043628 RepID=W7IFW4_9PEZI|nr:hypothetical protein DRE_02629 [Drechslerella stenobrocha 248]